MKHNMLMSLESSYTQFNFRVVLGDGATDAVDAGFQECNLTVEECATSMSRVQSVSRPANPARRFELNTLDFEPMIDFLNHLLFARTSTVTAAVELAVKQPSGAQMV